MSRHIKREKASLPVDVRGSKTSLLKVPNNNDEFQVVCERRFINIGDLLIINNLFIYLKVLLTITIPFSWRTGSLGPDAPLAAPVSFHLLESCSRLLGATKLLTTKYYQKNDQKWSVKILKYFSRYNWKARGFNSQPLPPWKTKTTRRWQPFWCG